MMYFLIVTAQVAQSMVLCWWRKEPVLRFVRRNLTIIVQGAVRSDYRFLAGAVPHKFIPATLISFNNTNTATALYMA